MTEIQWKQPPAHGSHKTDWEEIATALRSRPGAWALVRVGAPHAVDAHRIKAGVAAQFRPAGTFEARSVKTGEKSFDIYARYVGEATS